MIMRSSQRHFRVLRRKGQESEWWFFRYPFKLLSLMHLIASVTGAYVSCRRVIDLTSLRG